MSARTLGAAAAAAALVFSVSCRTLEGEEVMSRKTGTEANLARIVEADIIGTHAYQMLMHRKDGKGDAECWGDQGLSDADLQALVAHQKALLSEDPAAVKAWVEGGKSTFDPAKDLEPLVAAKLKLADNLPVNVYTDYFRSNTKATALQARALASIMQMMLDVDRDADELQWMFGLHQGLGLPVYTGQVGLAARTDEEFLKIGEDLSPRMCASPFDTDAVTLRMMFRKMWNWGQRYTGERDKYVLANELLAEPDIKPLKPKIAAMPAQRIAVIGHSFTMNVHWASPSAFVPIVTEMIKKHNPKAEVRQWEGGGLTPTRAYNNFFQEALVWKPDKVLFVVIPRNEEDYKRLDEMCKGFADASAKVFMFDNLRDPEDTPTRNERIDKIAADTGLTVIEVGQILHRAPDKDKFLALDKIHMTEPYHRLMAKEWLKFLVGARGAKVGAR